MNALIIFLENYGIPGTIAIITAWIIILTITIYFTTKKTIQQITKK